MFCRSCHYNLQGQTINRCPECGKPFDADDPGTFFVVIPGIANRVLRILRPVAAIGLTVAVVGYYGLQLLPRSECGGRLTNASFSRSNLQGLMTAWLIQNDEYPERTTLDLEFARAEARQRLSPWTEPTALYLRRAGDWLAAPSRRNKLIPLLGYAVLMAVICRARVRRVARWALVTVVAALVLCVVAPSVTRVIAPSSYRYLDDYVYVSGLDWSVDKAEQGTTVAIYEKFAWPSWRRLAAFMDGHISALPESELAELLANHGDSLMESDVPP